MVELIVEFWSRFADQHRVVSLLTELGFKRVTGYKHGAPNGALGGGSETRNDPLSPAKGVWRAPLLFPSLVRKLASANGPKRACWGNPPVPLFEHEPEAGENKSPGRSGQAILLGPHDARRIAHRYRPLSD